jgi:putative sterol carrier protein
MTTRDPVAGFFDELGARGHEPLLDKATGTVRFDVVSGRRTERWAVTVIKGELGVTRKDVSPDLVIRGERALLERVVRGEANAMAALLRGELTIDGDSELLVLVQRLFPRPRGARAAGRAAGYARRQR